MLRIKKDSLDGDQRRWFRRFRPFWGSRFRQRLKVRRLRRDSRPPRFPKLRRIGNFFVKRLRLGAVFSFIFWTLLAFFQSLWFRMVGVYVLTLLILLAVVLNQVQNYAWREINIPIIQSDGPVISVDDAEVAIIPPLPPSIGLEPGVLEGGPTIESIDAGEIVLPEGRYFENRWDFYYALEGEINVVFIITTMVVLVFGTAVFLQVTRPLVKIRKASQAISKGDHSARVKVRARNELGRVANAFNEMAEEIEKQDQARKKMVADVAHELRTPLTVMKSNLEAMLDGIIDPTNDELSELHDEVGRLSRMIEDLRMLSLADSGELPIIKGEVDVRQLLGTIVTRYTALAESREIELVLDDTSVPLIIYADADKMQQAIRNLLENALHYTPQGGRVRVTAVQDQARAQISIIDTGSGIQAEELENLFDRFWRGDRSRNRNSGGSGLGLAIVQQITELHGGSVTAVSPDGAGAVFTITMPLDGAKVEPESVLEISV
ncbi:MAG: ATP-binding protein [Chloroflexota bacterium]